jgi:hepatocyte growth factor-regulated tyrosine kinase substrate
MLEERLSNTYSQHTISGYNLAGQRHSLNIYPSIPSNIASGPGGAESFYTGNIQQEQHGRPQSTYSYGAPSQYPIYDNRASVAAPTYVAPDQRNVNYNQMPSQAHRSGSYSISSTYPQQFSAPTSDSQDPAYGPSQSQQPPTFAPSEPIITPSADANASFYYGNAPQNQQAPPHQGLKEQSQTPYPNIQSPPQHQQALHSAQSPQQFIHQQPQGHPQQPLPQFNQPQQGPTQQGSTQQGLTQQGLTQQGPTQQGPTQQAPPQQPYWQAQPQNSMPPQNWQQVPPSQQASYTQDSFPSAPQHTPHPQPVPVEESLIEF